MLVTERSATETILSVSVAVLSAGFGSGIPSGVATEAVFESVPAAVGLRVLVAVRVAVPPASRFTVVSMFPVPLETAHDEPEEPGAEEVEQVQAMSVNDAGNVSVTCALATASGPAFDTCIA